MRKSQVSDDVIIEAYRQTGSAGKASRMAGVSESIVYRRLKLHGIPVVTFDEFYRTNPPDILLPDHPAIVPGSCTQMKIGGHTGPCIQVVCPYCTKPRWIAYRTLKHQVVKSHWSGACKPCWSSQPKARTFRTNRNPSGRTTQSNGYVTLGKNAVADEELDIFDAMRGKAGHVLEHRWVMSKHLGRPLTSAECVDHMNGVKHDNRIENLRIYVRGKQQPGSCPGHGTYYHEWQMAELRVRELETQLAALA